MRRKVNKFGKKAAELDAWSDVLEYVEQQLGYQMNVKTDDDGNEVTDKDGNAIRIPPDENDDRYGYLRYLGWCEVLKTIEAMKI